MSFYTGTEHGSPAVRVSAMTSMLLGQLPKGIASATRCGQQLLDSLDSCRVAHAPSVAQGSDYIGLAVARNFQFYA
jgi:hypothetical protein